MERTHIASVCSGLQIKKIIFSSNSQCNKTKFKIINILKKIKVYCNTCNFFKFWNQINCIHAVYMQDLNSYPMKKPIYLQYPIQYHNKYMIWFFIIMKTQSRTCTRIWFNTLKPSAIKNSKKKINNSSLTPLEKEHAP